MIFFYLLVSVMPLAKHPLWSESIAGLTVVKYLGAAAFAYALYYYFARPSPVRFFATPQAYCFLLFALLISASYLMLGAPVPLGASALAAQLSFLQLFFITLVTIDSERRLRTLTLVIIGSIGFASLHTLREWQNAGFSSGYRPGWISGDPNYFSLSALLGLPLAFFLITGRTRLKKWERWFVVGCFGITLIALIGAASRGGLLGLGVVAILAVWRSRHRTKVLVLTTTVVLPLLLVAPSSPLGRLLSPSHSDEESTGNRLGTWRAALKMCGDHPVLGVGMGNFKEAIRPYGGREDTTVGEIIAHNTYLQIAAEAGVPSLVLLLMIQIGTIRTARRVQRLCTGVEPSLASDFAQGTELGMIAFGIAAVFISAEQAKLLWLLVFLTMALPAVAARARKRAATADSDALETSRGVRGRGPAEQRRLTARI